MPAGRRAVHLAAPIVVPTDRAAAEFTGAGHARVVLLLLGLHLPQRRVLGPHLLHGLSDRQPDERELSLHGKVSGGTYIRVAQPFWTHSLSKSETG